MSAELLMRMTIYCPGRLGRKYHERISHMVIVVKPEFFQPVLGDYLLCYCYTIFDITGSIVSL